jgi:hypothetical protein
MAASVGINLWVAHLDREGKYELGNQLDRRCRVLFPVCYFGLNGLSALVFLSFW